MRHGVYYTIRPLGDQWGIRVLTYRNGQLITEDLNTTPWPSRALAVVASMGAAEAEAERERLKVVGYLGTKER